MFSSIQERQLKRAICMNIALFVLQNISNLNLWKVQKGKSKDFHKCIRS